MPKKFSEANPEDTVCYQCSSCLYKCFSSMFGACGRNKRRTAWISLSILAPIGCLTVQLYIWANIEHSTSLDNTGYNDNWTSGTAISNIYLLYILSSAISKCITGFITEDCGEDDNNVDYDACYGTCSPTVWCFPCKVWHKLMYTIAPERDLDHNVSNIALTSIIFYNIAHHVVVNFGILTCIFLTLYLNGVILDTWWLSLSLVGLLSTIILILYYTFAGILWLFYICIGKCCIEPYYALRTKNEKSVDV